MREFLAALAGLDYERTEDGSGVIVYTDDDHAYFLPYPRTLH